MSDKGDITSTRQRCNVEDGPASMYGHGSTYACFKGVRAVPSSRPFVNMQSVSWSKGKDDTLNFKLHGRQLRV